VTEARGGMTVQRESRRVSRWLLAILFATVFEGAFRKWILPDYLHPLAYATKDVLVILFVLHFAIPRQQRALLQYRRTVGAIAVLLLPGLAIGIIKSPISAILVFKNAVLWPLFAISMAAWVDCVVLNKMTRAVAIICIMMAVLAAVQFASPSNSLINRYAWDEAGLKTIHSGFIGLPNVRATGTFSYISGLATFGAMAFCWLVWQISLARRRRPLWTVGSVAALLCILTSGSRGPLIIAVLGLLAAILVTARRRVRITALVIMFLIGVVATFSAAITQAYLSRIESAGDNPLERILGSGVAFLAPLAEHPIGVGLGQETPAEAFRRVKAGEITSASFIEDGRTRVAIEGGVPALAAHALTVVLLFHMIARAWRTKEPGNRIGTAVFAPALIYLLSNSLWFDHNGSAMWWIAIGSWLGLTVGARYILVRTLVRGPQAA